MKHDVFGQQVSLAADQTVSDWNAAQLGFLAHSATTPGHLAAVLRAEPDFALGQAARGLFYLLLGRRELIANAREALMAAETGLEEGRATSRERYYVDALRHWLAGRVSGAVAAMEQVLGTAPGDPLAMKLSQAIRFIMGDAGGMRESVERLLPTYAPDHPARGYLLGCHAFALEETGEYVRAEIAGRQALWMAPDDAWGLHAVAHVYDMTGRTRQGLDWLSAREAAWAHCNNFAYHVWWHKALMHLDQGQIDEVLELYDRRIRAESTDDYRDIANGASLLMRLELEGIDVGGRWEEMAEISAHRTADGCLIFADLHYLLALEGGGRNGDSAALLARMRRDAGRHHCEADARMAVPGLEAAEGVRAFAEARYDTAFRHLAQARSSLQLAGGSHAQRDVFERLTIDAGLRTGRMDKAEQFLNERQARRAGSEDAYAAARRKIIAAVRNQPPRQSVNAQ